MHAETFFQLLISGRGWGIPGAMSALARSSMRWRRSQVEKDKKVFGGMFCSASRPQYLSKVTERLEGGSVGGRVGGSFTFHPVPSEWPAYR